MVDLSLGLRVVVGFGMGFRLSPRGLNFGPGLGLVFKPDFGWNFLVGFGLPAPGWNFGPGLDLTFEPVFG